MQSIDPLAADTRSNLWPRSMDASVDRYRPPAHNPGEVNVVEHVANQGVSGRDPVLPISSGCSHGWAAWAQSKSTRPSQQNQRLWATFHRLGEFIGKERRPVAVASPSLQSRPGSWRLAQETSALAEKRAS